MARVRVLISLLWHVFISRWKNVHIDPRIAVQGAIRSSEVLLRCNRKAIGSTSNFQFPTPNVRAEPIAESGGRKVIADGECSDSKPDDMCQLIHLKARTEAAEECIPQPNGHARLELSDESHLTRTVHEFICARNALQLVRSQRRSHISLRGKRL